MITFAHVNFNVVDMERSIAFYKEALGLGEVRRRAADDGSYLIVFLGDGQTGFRLELTWLRDWGKDRYDLGDEEFHLAFGVDDFAAVKEKHAAMHCICYENNERGVYFINDPDGYWIEIVPR